MITETEENCKRLSETIRTLEYKILWAVYVIFCLLGLVVIIPILQNIFKFMLSPITMSLTKIKLLFSIVFSISFTLTSIFHFYNYLTATRNCDYLFYVKDCVWSFPLVTFCLIGMTTSQAGLSIARLLSTVNVSAKYDESTRLGHALSAAVILVTLVSLALGLIESDPTEPRIFCALIPTSTANTSNLLFYFLLALDFVTLFIYLMSWYRNKKLREATWYSLTLKFKIADNYRGIKLCLPIVVMHFLMFGFYTITTINLRNQRAWMPINSYSVFGLGLFIIPLYILIQNLLLCYIIRVEMKRRREFQTTISLSTQQYQTDAHFKELYNQWN